MWLRIDIVTRNTWRIHWFLSEIWYRLITILSSIYTSNSILFLVSAISVGAAFGPHFEYLLDLIVIVSSFAYPLRFLNRFLAQSRRWAPYHTGCNRNRLPVSQQVGAMDLWEMASQNGWNLSPAIAQWHSSNRRTLPVVQLKVPPLLWDLEWPSSKH